jgi:hypothetical protein
LGKWIDKQGAKEGMYRVLGIEVEIAIAPRLSIIHVAQAILSTK